MTGITVSKARTHSSDLISRTPALENRAAKIFQHSRWLNDMSLPLLLMLAASLANRSANAQQETDLNGVIITAQNQFGTVSQLTIRDGVLYLLEDGCNLVQIRQLSDADIAAIQALSLLTVEEVGLHLQLVSYAPMGSADLSEFCVSSDPVSSFITSIRQDDSDSSSFAGLLAGGLGLLLGLAGGGGGGGGTPAPDRTAFTIDDDSQSDAEEESFALGDVAGASAASANSLTILEGTYGDEDDSADVATGIEVEVTDRDGRDITTITSSDDRFVVTSGEIRIKKGTVFNYETDKKSFDVTLKAGGQTRILKITLADQVLAEDVETELSEAKVRRDGDMVFEPIKISDDDHDDTALDAAKFILIAEDGGDDDEDISDKFVIENKDKIYQLRLKDDQDLKEVDGPVNIQILALTLSSETGALKGEIESLDKITKTGGAKVTNSLDLNGLTIEKTLPDITLTSHKYILLKKMGSKAVFEAVTQTELNSRTGDFAVVAELYTDIEDIKDKGLIKTQLQQDGKDYFNLEVMEITLDLTDDELDETATSAADDFLGDADNNDDSVSYDEAEAADARNVDIDGDGATTDDQITGIDGVIIDLSATASDTQSTPVKYSTKSKDAADSEVITLGAEAGNLAAGDKLTSIENLVGSDHDDVLIGSAVNNQLDGGDGDDHLYGRAGDDSLNGEDGDDSLHGGAGDDSLNGEDGDDSLHGGTGDDSLDGGDGADILDGGDGDDTASYSSSSSVTARDILLKGETYGDITGVFARLDKMEFDAAVKTANALGGSPVTITTGDKGDKYIVLKQDGALEAVTDAELAALTGEYVVVAALYTEADSENDIKAGDIQWQYRHDGETIFEDRNSDGTYSLNSNFDASTLIQNGMAYTSSGDEAAGDILLNIENITGSDHDDLLVGDGSANILNGREGNDILFGGAGDDTLIGGDGEDALHGGDGNSDTASYTGAVKDDRSKDIVIAENSANGITAQTIDEDDVTGVYVNLNLDTQEKENNSHAAGDALLGIENITGSSHDDLLVGDGSANILTGGAGEDILIGGDGIDTASYEGANSVSRSSDITISSNSANGISSRRVDNAEVTGVYVNLNSDTQSGTRNSHAAGDKLTSIENLVGSEHDDLLVGDGSVNILDGGDGDDILIAGKGDDTLIGGEGDDELTGGDGADILDGGDGDDTASFSNSGSVTTRNIRLNDITYNGINGVFVRLGKMDFDSGVTAVTYTNTTDTKLTSTSSARYIILNQNGTLEVVANFDSKNADEFVVVADLATNGDIEWQYRYEGENIFNETTGRTYTLNSAFNTSALIQNGMAYTATGDEANGDVLMNIENIIGSGRKDLLIGDEGDNTLDGGNEDDTLIGGAGDDTLIGDDDNDTLIGGAGDDTLIGDDDNDTLIGGAGDDTLIGGDDEDNLDGGDGDGDTASYVGSNAGVTVRLDKMAFDSSVTALTYQGGGTSLSSNSGDDYIVLKKDGELEALTDTQVAGLTTGEYVVVASISSSSGNINWQYRYEGENIFNETTGRSYTLNSDFAKATVDNMMNVIGGALINNGIAYTGDNGDADGDILANIENLIGSSRNDRLTGDAGDNRLEGAAGTDTLIGGAGDDTLIGGTGSDTLTGGDGDDTLIGGTGSDTLTGGDGEDTASYAGAGSATRTRDITIAANTTNGITADTIDKGDVTGVYVNLSLTGAQTTINNSNASGDKLTSVENIVGSDHDDLLVGDGSANILTGGDGDDILIGGDGDDTLEGGAGTDELDGGDGIDRLDGGAGDDTLLGGDDNDILIGGDGDDILIGGDGDDTLEGGAGTDELDGGDGIDRLDGGDGDDTLLGGDDNDILIGGDGEDILFGGDGMDVLIGGGGSDILIGEGDMDLFRLEQDDDGTDTVLGFTLGEDKIQIDIDEDVQDGFTLADLGLEVIESSDGMHAHIVNASDDSHIYMTIENIDHEDLTIADFEII